jgi:hypothetical protein
MARNRSIDDLRTAHLHLIKSLETVIITLPPYFGEQKVALDVIYADIEAASKARTCVGVQKTTDQTARSAWAERAADAISRAKHFLRATAPDLVREYFPEAGGVASRKIDRLHAISKALTVSEHFNHAHLGAFRAELEVLRLEGEPIFGAASASRTEQKTEVERLAGLKARWEDQYQKLKFLVRGYYHATATDWTKFFDDSRLAKCGPAKESAEQASPAASEVALAS